MNLILGITTLKHHNSMKETHHGPDYTQGAAENLKTIKKSNSNNDHKGHVNTSPVVLPNGPY
jgi:hypothetical protein